MKIAICGPVSIPEVVMWLNLQDPPKGQFAPNFGSNSVTFLVEGLLESGHEVVVVALNSSVESDFRLVGEGLTLRVGPYRRRHRARDFFKEERAAIERALREEQPDVVHAQWTYEYALGAIASEIPTVVTVRDWAPSILRWHTHPYRMVRLAMNWRTLATAQQLTTVSSEMARRLSRTLRRDIPVIPNALPDRRFGRVKMELDIEHPSIIAVNNGFSRFKNVKKLIEALPRIRSRSPGCSLELLGNDFGPDGPAELWARGRGLAEGIRFRGPQSPVVCDEAIARSDLLVHPSLEESFGMVLVEAMARGVPVVGGSESGAVPWVLDQGAAGVLTDVRSSNEIADSVLSVIQSRERWLKLSSAGYDRAREYFNLSSVTQAYLREYERAYEATGS